MNLWQDGQVPHKLAEGTGGRRLFLSPYIIADPQARMCFTVIRVNTD